jgi:chaperonin GroES
MGKNLFSFGERGTMKIGMVKTRVLVLADKAPEKSKGGIILLAPDAIDAGMEVYSPGTGVVVEKASKVASVEVGDRIFFGKYVGAPIELDGEKYLMMNEDDIQAILYRPKSKSVVRREKICRGGAE